MASTSSSRNLYRKLLKFSTGLPADKHASTIKTIREEFRKNIYESDPSKIDAMIKKGFSSLSYIKMVTPRGQDVPQNGAYSIKFDDKGGKRSKAVSNWVGSNMDPDSVSRHNNSLKRGGWKSNSDMKGMF